MLVCMKCGRQLSDCCDLFYPVINDEGKQIGVVCGDCAAIAEGNGGKLNDDGSLDYRYFADK